MRLPQLDSDEFSHYDTPLGLHPTPLPPGLATGLAGSLTIASAERRVARKRRLSELGGNGGGAKGGVERVASISSVDGEDDDDGEDGGAVAVAYGEGLAVLLSHLAAARRPRVQAWLQLKEDLVRSDAAALHATQSWDDLNDLEADFIVTNAQHLQNKSWLTS